MVETGNAQLFHAQFKLPNYSDSVEVEQLQLEWWKREMPNYSMPSLSLKLPNYSDSVEQLPTQRAGAANPETAVTVTAVRAVFWSMVMRELSGMELGDEVEKK
jgi:hypothetical protein